MSVVDRWFVLTLGPEEGYDRWFYGAWTRRGRMIFTAKLPAAPEYRGDPDLLRYLERRLEAMIAAEIRKTSV